MVKQICHWLPIIFGCHCRSDRSFFWKEKQFPICARCTGELVGILAVCLTGWFYMFPIAVCVVFLIPMIVDGTVQMLSSYESRNLRRFITGLLFGIGLTTLFAYSSLAAIDYGCQIGRLAAAG